MLIKLFEPYVQCGITMLITILGIFKKWKKFTRQLEKVIVFNVTFSVILSAMRSGATNEVEVFQSFSMPPHNRIYPADS